MMAASKFFKALLGPNFREANQKELVLKEIHGVSLKSIIDYCYTGNIDITENNVAYIVAAAFSFNLAKVEQKCAQFWESILSVENCVSILQMADKYNLLDLRSKALTFICKKFAVVSIANLLEINGENFGKLLDSDQIRTSENIVFDRLKRWAAQNENERANFVPNFLKTIRLDLLESKVFPCFIHSRN